VIYFEFIKGEAKLPAIINELNWLDVFFIILLLGMVYKGARTGVAGQMIPLIGTLALVYAPVRFYRQFSEAMFGTMLQEWAKPVSFFIICILVMFITKIIDRLFSLIASDDMALIERIAGMLIAGFRSVVYLGVISYFLLLLPLPAVNTAVDESSGIALKSLRIDSSIFVLLSRIFEKEREFDRSGIYDHPGQNGDDDISA
jgi:uncharacterized membrane protein required for colicin V production